MTDHVLMIKKLILCKFQEHVLKAHKMLSAQLVHLICVLKLIPIVQHWMELLMAHAEFDL